MRGYQRVQLWVDEDNAPAQRLFAGHGFVPTDRTKPDDEGDIIRLRHRWLAGGGGVGSSEARRTA